MFGQMCDPQQLCPPTPPPSLTSTLSSAPSSSLSARASSTTPGYVSPLPYRPPPYVLSLSPSAWFLPDRRTSPLPPPLLTFSLNFTPDCITRCLQVFSFWRHAARYVPPPLRARGSCPVVRRAPCVSGCMCVSQDGALLCGLVDGWPLRPAGCFLFYFAARGGFTLHRPPPGGDREGGEGVVLI